MEKILARYRVCDCEHEGDISSACMEVTELGGEVISTEWDGEDCGEAYVYCLIDKQTFDKVKGIEWQSAEYMRDYFTSKKLI